MIKANSGLSSASMQSTFIEMFRQVLAFAYMPCYLVFYAVFPHTNSNIPVSFSTAIAKTSILKNSNMIFLK